LRVFVPERFRIAHVHWAFPPTTGGVESHLYDLARLQTARGHEVTVVTGEPEPTSTGEYEIVSTPLLKLESIRDAELDPAYADHLRTTLRKLLARRGVDVVHGHDLHHFTPEPALVLTDLRRELGFSLHHTFHETWPDVLADRPVYRTWDGNYAVSTFVQSGCEHRLGFRPLLFPLAVDTTVFRPTKPPFSRAGEPVLLHPARLLPWKGVHHTIELLSLLRRHGLRPRLLLTDTQRIADWECELDAYREEINGMIDAEGLRDNVEFVRPRFAEMPALYNRADIVLYPTVADEPFGLVPLEAMSSERPVVASRCGGIAETVVDGVTGYTTDPGDVEALAARVAALLRDRRAACSMGAAGRRHVRERFDLHRYGDALDAHYAAGRGSDR
jgi:glycosyltransferase involved in cell wall biosynthesis